MSTRISVDADLEFTLDLPGRAPVAGHLRGSGQSLELHVDAPETFAGRADSDAIRQLARRLAGFGVTVRVMSGGAELLALGVRQNSWLQRRVTGSRHMRVRGPHGAWTAVLARSRRGGQPVLPDATLAPPATLTPLAPTFLRRPARPATTTHDPGAGGQPRLVLVPREDAWPGDTQRRYHLRDVGTTSIGSAESCDIRLRGLEPVHAEVRHDDRDEFVLVSHSPGDPVRVNGETVADQVLRTGSRVDIGGWTMTFYREEYADHGRPHGGRIGGELGHQRPQPPRRPTPFDSTGEAPHD